MGTESGLQQNRTPAFFDPKLFLESGSMKTKVVIAGATGFVGKALVENLKKDFHVIGLSRSQKKSTSDIEWRVCDLFSLLDAEKALEGADVAIYLVHSMRPSAHLTQGGFEDFDLIVGDNFVRAAQKARVKHILYLGGMKPQAAEVSAHLRSRREVEQLFRTSEIPSTIFRAAVILGGNGSSFHIMTRLVERLPVLACPTWTQTKSQPVALQDVVRSFAWALKNPESHNKVYDIGSPEPVSYQKLMCMIARKKGLRRRIINVPFISPRLSVLWVCSITGAPVALVKPLVEGLKEDLLVRPEHRLQLPDGEFLNASEAIDQALQGYDSQKSPLAFHGSPEGPNIVRSVQRLPLPKGVSAEEVGKKYLEFLPLLRPGFLKVEVQEPWIYFLWRFPKTRLLVLEYSESRSWKERQLFYVRGGLLAKKKTKGRLEFRQVQSGDAIIAAIHDFEPRLPWFIYLWSQAWYHLWVMGSFGRYLNSHSSIMFRKMRQRGLTEVKKS